MHDFRRIRAALAALTLAIGLWLAPGSAVRAQVALDLRDADLRSFVQVVSEATGRSFVLDPAVRGTVTVLAPQEMSADALYEVFLSVLELNRLAVIEGAGADRIVPMSVARELAPGDDEGIGIIGADGYETRVISVQHVPLSEIVEVVRPLLPSEAVLTPVPGANLLILSDRGTNFRRIEKLIQRLDVPRSDPVDMVPLHNADAAEVSQVIQSLGIVPPGASVTVDRRSNSLVVSGSSSLREQVRVLATRLDTQGGRVDSWVEQLNYAEAATLADVVLRSFADDQSVKGQAIRIVPEPRTNSMLITAPAETMPHIIAMVRHLDRRPVQVLVEAVIFEMSVQGFSDLSVQFGAVLNNAVVGGVQFTLEGRPSLTSLVSSVLNGTTPDVGPGGIFGGAKQNGDNGFVGLLTAIAATNSTRLLSTPSIMTLNNQEAEIVVAQNVPFVTGSFTSTGTGSNPENPFQTIERQDVGLTLNVTPQINADETVRMIIKQEVSNLTNTTSASGGEITARRALSTTVLVHDGNVVMLGGLLENGSGAVSQKVPGLSNLPLLGGLFEGKNAERDQRVLLVMLRPQVVASDAEAERLTRKAAQDARNASLAAQPLDSGRYPRAPSQALPFDGADLNQPFDAGFIDDLAQSRNFPPLPTRLRFGE
ncbi:type II secretion system secretin GspD [Ruegeria aquimaris]|uniref:Type II secretion system secretin GspD n=1 Tax=Ruegeria aquimaris TaxID=2984333 RepID=A0ABT3ASC4_9RHOB|nr:type II secretion system secretin GspD [Ruegeria sp. XHP0148]MCV2891202.1 type II secretion system secretin GspD [Ruegeria sp. XHP0148]